MRKFCITFAFALALCVGSCFALSPDDSTGSLPDSAPADSVGSHLLGAVSYAASSAGWTDTDHDYLNQIRLTLTQSNNGSIRGILGSLLTNSDNIYNKLFAIKQSTDYLQNINNNGNSILSYLRDDFNGPSIRELLTAIKDYTHDISSVWLATQAHDIWYHVSNMGIRFNDFYNNFFGFVQEWPGGPGTVSLSGSIVDIAFSTAYDRKRASDGSWTLYHYVKQLSDVLASDDDKALVDSQKSNRDQIEQDFVSGSSGKTSLGASDFGDLSSVGGSVKDSLSLNGQSSISGFTGGLSDADDAGQGWFSSSTRDALDTVSSSSSSSSSRVRRAPDDTYNMAGFLENYSWLYGE